MEYFLKPTNIPSYQSSPSLSTVKKRLVRVATKVNEKAIIDKSLEKDFELELGDPTEFLKSDPNSNMFNSREINSRLNSVGSSRLFDLNKDRSEAISASSQKREIFRKKFTVKSAFRPIIENEVQIATKISSINKRIEENKKNLQLKLKSMNSIDRIVYLQQLTCLNKFEKTKNDWKKIEEGLKKKVKKGNSQLLGHLSRETSARVQEPIVPWNTTLRCSKKLDKVEKFLPVGNKLSGIYLKEVLNNNPVMHRKSASCPDLTVFGYSKLPLEIEAFKIPGNKLFSRKEGDDCGQDEVLVEKYSSRVNKLWAG